MGRMLMMAAMLGAAALGADGAMGQMTIPPGFTRTSFTVSGTSGTAMVRRPDGSILVAMKDGTVRVFRNGFVTAPFYTFADVNSTAEGGLIGITIDPDYANNGFVYARVSRTTGGGIMRLTAAGDVAVAGSEMLIFPIPVSGGIHQGGAVHFGPDGELYFTIGETGSGSNAPLLTNLLGKIMRINADGTIPADNPFYTTAMGDNRAIWAKGLRNPYTFAFQPGTGRLHINHVGGQWEEVNVGVAGADYGWPSTEGTFTQSQHPTFTEPLFAYQTIPGAAIIGAAFYNPATMHFPAEYRGQYFFGDYVRGTIRRLDPATGVVTDFGTGFSLIVDLDVHPDGRLVVLTRSGTPISYIDYPIGACCAGATCTVKVRSGCAAAGYHGEGTACSPVACCAANFNYDEVVSVQDIFDFLNAWFAGDPRADFDGVAGLSVQDVFSFLEAWFVGCP